MKPTVLLVLLAACAGDPLGPGDGCIEAKHELETRRGFPEWVRIETERHTATPGFYELWIYPDSVFDFAYGPNTQCVYAGGRVRLPGD